MGRELGCPRRRITRQTDALRVAGWKVLRKPNMPFLTFTNPPNIPAYEGWDFEVLPAHITLRIEDMRDKYADYVDDWRDTVSRMSKETGRYKEYLRISELLELLNKALAEGDNVELDGNDYIWSFCSNIMFERRFVSVLCPGCNHHFNPEECKVEKWIKGGGLAGEGGRRVICASGHTLYACREYLA